jgi:hypothetical protein
MHYKLIIKATVFFIVVLVSIFSGDAFCQNDFEKMLAKKVDSLLKPEYTQSEMTQLFPNDAAQTATVPSGWGGYGTYIFGGVGGVYPQVYHTNADLIAFGGFCIGDPIKAVNFAAGVNMTNVHEFKDFSGNFNISRVVGPGSSISVGGLQLLAPHSSDAPGATYYFAFSHAIQSLPSSTAGASKLTYTIGIGNGRFYLKSPDDIAAGKGRNGTAVYGGVSYEVIQHINLIAEWDGVNLAVSTGIRPFKKPSSFLSPLSLTAGVANITRFSANRPDFLFSVGYPLAVNRQKN